MAATASGPIQAYCAEVLGQANGIKRTVAIGDLLPRLLLTHVQPHDVSSLLTANRDRLAKILKAEVGLRKAKGRSLF